MDLHRVAAGRAAAERVGGGDREAVDADLPRRAVDLGGRLAVAPEREARGQRARDEPVARGPVAVGSGEVGGARLQAQERADVARGALDLRAGRRPPARPAAPGASAQRERATTRPREPTRFSRARCTNAAGPFQVDYRGSLMTSSLVKILPLALAALVALGAAALPTAARPR